jgi:hypothetical protein
MKTLIASTRLMSGVLAVMTTTALAQAPAATNAPAAAGSGAPKVVCDAPVFDFGVVMGQDSVSHKFILKNVGGQELNVEKVQTSCGCTTAQLSTQKIPAGGQVELSATLSLVGRRGRQQKSIYVMSNDPASPQYRVEITGEVRREIDVSPEMVVFSGTEGDQPPDQKVTVTVNLDTNVLLTGVETNNQSRYGVTMETVEAGKRYTLTVRLNTNGFTSGSARDQVTVRTDHPKFGQVGIPIFTTIQKEVTAVPVQLQVVISKEPDPAFRDIYVNSNRQKPVEITKVELPDPEAKTDVAKLNDGQHRIRITGMKGSMDLNGKTIRIHVKRWDNKEDTLDIPVQVQRVEAPSAPQQPPAHP